MIYYPAEDSYLLQEQVKKYSKGKTFLDLGAGSGIQSRTALPIAKSVLAADIEKESVEEMKKQGIPAMQSNLFSKIKGKFDLIAFNPPYLPLDEREDKESRKITTGGKKGDEITIKFLKQAKTHLNKKGKILLVLSSLTPKKKIFHLLKSMNYSKKKLSEKTLFMESIEVWLIRR